jgi:hypothetical protein
MLDLLYYLPWYGWIFLFGLVICVLGYTGLAMFTAGTEKLQEQINEGIHWAGYLENELCEHPIYYWEMNGKYAEYIPFEGWYYCIFDGVPKDQIHTYDEMQKIIAETRNLSWCSVNPNA